MQHLLSLLMHKRSPWRKAYLIYFLLYWLLLHFYIFSLIYILERRCTIWLLLSAKGSRVFRNIDFTFMVWIWDGATFVLTNTLLLMHNLVCHFILRWPVRYLYLLEVHEWMANVLALFRVVLMIHLMVFWLIVTT